MNYSCNSILAEINCRHFNENTYSVSILCLKAVYTYIYIKLFSSSYDEYYNPQEAEAILNINS